MKKRIVPLLLALVLLLAAVPVPARAAGDVVYVTIAHRGDMQIVRYPVVLQDKNGNGYYDVDDALRLAHNEETGQLGGYTSSSDPGKTEGIWITMLWSIWHAGWVGFTVNGEECWSAADPVKAGDEIYAWNYFTTDSDPALSDVRGYFDSETAPVTTSVRPGESVTLTLGPELALHKDTVVKVYPMQANGWKLDKRYSPEYVQMDSSGNITYTFEEAGTYCIIAENKQALKALVPPYRMVFVRDFTYGDANGDGTVNGKDVLLLSRYLADWNVEPDMRGADANGDGTVNGKDVLLLSRYLADWDVTLGPA